MATEKRTLVIGPLEASQLLLFAMRAEFKSVLAHILLPSGLGARFDTRYDDRLSSCKFVKLGRRIGDFGSANDLV